MKKLTFFWYLFSLYSVTSEATVVLDPVPLKLGEYRRAQVEVSSTGISSCVNPNGIEYRMDTTDIPTEFVLEVRSLAPNVTLENIKTTNTTTNTYAYVNRMVKPTLNVEVREINTGTTSVALAQFVQTDNMEFTIHLVPNKTPRISNLIKITVKENQCDATSIKYLPFSISAKLPTTKRIISGTAKTDDNVNIMPNVTLSFFNREGVWKGGTTTGVDGRYSIALEEGYYTMLLANEYANTWYPGVPKYKAKEIRLFGKDLVKNVNLGLQPTITNNDPLIPVKATPLTIYGNHFGTKKGLIDFAGIAASSSAVTLWTDTQINVNVPNAYPGGCVRIFSLRGGYSSCFGLDTQ